MGHLRVLQEKCPTLPPHLPSGVGTRTRHTQHCAHSATLMMLTPRGNGFESALHLGACELDNHGCPWHCAREIPCGLQRGLRSACTVTSQPQPGGRARETEQGAADRGGRRELASAHARQLPKIQRDPSPSGCGHDMAAQLRQQRVRAQGQLEVVAAAPALHQRGAAVPEQAQALPEVCGGAVLARLREGPALVLEHIVLMHRPFEEDWRLGPSRRRPLQPLADVFTVPVRDKHNHHQRGDEPLGRHQGVGQVVRRDGTCLVPRRSLATPKLLADNVPSVEHDGAAQGPRRRGQWERRSRPSARGELAQVPLLALRRLQHLEGRRDLLERRVEVGLRRRPLRCVPWPLVWVDPSGQSPVGGADLCRPGPADREAHSLEVAGRRQDAADKLLLRGFCNSWSHQCALGRSLQNLICSGCSRLAG
mmetsp:Transcript_32147/g.100321  ORF Transcript_32147/g.100321 Transcript_32147/m.100321 type:complete len:422 (+) Transcript_32147:78-1343(+)